MFVGLARGRSTGEGADGVEAGLETGGLRARDVDEAGHIGGGGSGGEDRGGGGGSGSGHGGVEAGDALDVQRLGDGLLHELVLVAGLGGEEDLDRVQRGALLESRVVLGAVVGDDGLA